MGNLNCSECISSKESEKVDELITDKNKPNSINDADYGTLGNIIEIEEDSKKVTQKIYNNPQNSNKIENINSEKIYDPYANIPDQINNENEENEENNNNENEEQYEEYEEGQLEEGQEQYEDGEYEEEGEYEEGEEQYVEDGQYEGEYEEGEEQYVEGEEEQYMEDGEEEQNASVEIHQDVENNENNMEMENNNGDNNQ